MNIQKLVRRSVAKLPSAFPTIADVPISDVKQMIGVNDIVKLSANENPLGPSPKAIIAMSEALIGINRYPDSMARALRGTIGRKVNLDPRYIILSSGLEGGLQLLSETILEAGDEVIIPEHSPTLYRRMAQRMDAAVVTVKLLDWNLSFTLLQKVVTSQTKLIILGNPLDPTGTTFSLKDLQQFLTKLPQETIVAIDESYGEFADSKDYRTAVELITDFPNLVILRSFSAFYGLASARIGYLITSLDLGGYMNRIRLPFQISSISQAGALAGLQDAEHQQQTKEALEKGKTFLYELFEDLGLTFVPSQGNFVLVDIGHDSSQVLNALAKRGIIIRMIESLPTHIRVSVGTIEELDQFSSALRDILGSL